MSDLFKQVPHEFIEQQLNICEDIANSAEQRFHELLAIKHIDSFKAKHTKLDILTNVERIQRICVSFRDKYKDSKNIVFHESSVPVLQLYVAQERAKKLTDFSL